MKLEKITKKQSDSSKSAMNRRYGDACAAAHALELIGDRWALLVARELMIGPRRFSSLRRGLPAISANVLTQRLEELEAMGVVERVEEDGVVRYALTPWGQELEAVTQALGRWGARSPAHDPMLPFGATSLMLSLRTMIDHDAARVGGDYEAAIIVGKDPFRLTLTDGALSIVRGKAPAPAFTLTVANANLILPSLYGSQPLAISEKQGVIEATGDREIAQRFLNLFALPDQIGGNTR